MKCKMLNVNLSILHLCMQTVLSQVDFDTAKMEQQLVVKGSTFEAIKSSSDGVGRHQHKETGNGTGEPAQKVCNETRRKIFSGHYQR